MLRDFLDLMLPPNCKPYRSRGHGGRMVKRPGQHARNAGYIRRRTLMKWIKEPAVPQRYAMTRFMRKDDHASP